MSEKKVDVFVQLIAVWFLYVIRVRRSRLSCNPSYCSYIRWIDILIDFCVVIAELFVSLSLSKGVFIVESYG